MVPERNSYIVTKALNNYLKGSVIIAISGHLVTTIDAVVVSRLISPKAFTAVNIVIPVLTLFSSLMIMLSTGVSVSISRAVGNRDRQKVDLSSSSTLTAALILGSVYGILTYFFSGEIVKVLAHGDKSLFHFANLYLKNFSYAIPFLILAGSTGAIIRTDGNNRLVRIAVWMGLFINGGLDILFVGPLGFGIAGAAWSTAINYLVVFIICLFHFASEDNTIRWSFNFKGYFRQIMENFKLGFSTSLTNLLMAVSLFVINTIMIHSLGNEGIYCWAVCYQIFLIQQMLLSGVDAGIFSLGGVMLGEDDMTGLHFLYRRSVFYLINTIIVLCGVIILFPGFFGHIFGNTGDDHLKLLPRVLKIFSLFLFPYAMVMQVRAIYTILGRGGLSLFLCVASFGLMILLVFLSSIYETHYVWWSFPVSGWLLFIFLTIYSTFVHLKNKNLSFFSLIPKKVSDPALNSSVALDEGAVDNAGKNIEDFLKEHGVAGDEISAIEEVTGKIMHHILAEGSPAKKNRYFDVNARIKGKEVIIIIKDDGKRLDRKTETDMMATLNPAAATDSGNRLSPSGELNLTTNYFYMNEQNTFTLNFVPPAEKSQ